MATIPITKVPASVTLTLKEYAALGEPGDNVPPGIDPDDWHSNRVIAIGTAVDGQTVRQALAPGQLMEDDAGFKLGLPVDKSGKYQWLTIPKTDLNDPTDFTSVKNPFPPETKIVSLTATVLEVAD